VAGLPVGESCRRGRRDRVAKITNVTVSGNSAGSIGGGVSIQGGTTLIEDTTFARNSARFVGGLLGFGGKGTGNSSKAAIGRLELANSGARDTVCQFVRFTTSPEPGGPATGAADGR
jgi:hypothetical protein